MGVEERERSTLRLVHDVDRRDRATLIVRHAEREAPSSGAGPVASEDVWQLTPGGREQARKFGASLPAFDHLFLSHTRIARTRDTASEIAEGFQRKHPASHVRTAGIDPALSLTTFYARDDALREQWRVKLGEQFYHGWVVGAVPPEAIAPVAMAVTDLVARLRTRHDEGPESALHVAVTHDVFITAIREVLFGPWMNAQPPVGFLEGVLLAEDSTGRLTARWSDQVAVVSDRHG